MMTGAGIIVGAGVLIADNAFSDLYINDFTTYEASWITKLFLKASYRF
jgi:hypothetical protein